MYVYRVVVPYTITRPDKLEDRRGQKGGWKRGEFQTSKMSNINNMTEKHEMCFTS